MGKKEEEDGWLWIVTLSFAFGASVFEAWVVKLLWRWYVTWTWHVTEPTLVAAWGVALLAHVLTFRIDWATAKDSVSEVEKCGRLVYVALVHAFILLSGYAGASWFR